ncbi:nonphototropic hypocotyl 1 [Triangularia setosa]|uniref:Nonphototropic hypocotyl 1 n=1 Tax=Triangularia setosa TaxID=2587417 RepID=A0AAN7A9K9_9PEZI|nr:nonphototropic hypocotyl 1 [Podospora setosa]
MNSRYADGARDNTSVSLGAPEIPPKSSSRFLTTSREYGGQFPMTPPSPRNKLGRFLFARHNHKSPGFEQPGRFSPVPSRLGGQNRISQEWEADSGHITSPKSHVFSLTRSDSSKTSLDTKSRPASVASAYMADSASMLYALQERGPIETDDLEPLEEEEFSSSCYDLVAPAPVVGEQYLLEERSDLLFSREHLEVIFSDPNFLASFTAFVRTRRPASVPLLVYYFESLKAMKALEYSNAVLGSLKSLEDHPFTQNSFTPTVNSVLQERMDMAFEALVREELPAFITHRWIQAASLTIRKRVTGTLPEDFQQLSEGLAEVFCLTDPSREDNPVIFASDDSAEFYRTTQYSVKHVIGRNCRFLQGPKTNPVSVDRIRDKLAAGKEHYETILNYRRDGSPFMNLLLCAPLLDSQGMTRYMIGAQIDISGLAQECAGLDSLRMLVDQQQQQQQQQVFASSPPPPTSQQADQAVAAAAADKTRSVNVDPQVAFRNLAEMLTAPEIETIRKHGGERHRFHFPSSHNLHHSHVRHSPNTLHNDDHVFNTAIPGSLFQPSLSANIEELSDLSGGKLTGIYSQYLLLRPYPSLRILFASPSLRLPGILQTPFLSRIGGSDRVREELSQGFKNANVVTAKIKWLTRTRISSWNGATAVAAMSQQQEGRTRWIHCTPLMGSNGAVGVWMVVIVDDDTEINNRERSRKVAPVIDPGFLRRGKGGTESRMEEGGVDSQMGTGRGGRVDYDAISLASLSHLDLSLSPDHGKGHEGNVTVR